MYVYIYMCIHKSLLTHGGRTLLRKKKKDMWDVRDRVRELADIYCEVRRFCVVETRRNNNTRAPTRTVVVQPGIYFSLDFLYDLYTM